MKKGYTITSDKATNFDPGENRVTNLGNNTSSTESGAYIDNGSIDSAVNRATQAMPEPSKK
jgi:hypothetical protein